MTDIPWLDADEQQAWRSVVHGTNRLLDLLDVELKAEGLSHDDYGVLVALSEAAGERLRMSELADAVVESRSRLSHHIGRMEKRGLVARSSCPDDRRGSWAALTADGRAAIERLAPHHVAGVRRWFLDHLSADELATLAAVFTRVDAAIRAGTATGGPIPCDPDDGLDPPHGAAVDEVPDAQADAQADEVRADAVVGPRPTSVD